MTRNAIAPFKVPKGIEFQARGGDRNLEVRAEGFNVTDRANFGLPSTTLFNARGARLTTAGRITNTITTARQGHVAMRFAF